jgi:glycogen debranching enzyme
MTVAPELFDPLHAVRCLDLVEERLLGTIGMRTLDTSDWRYRPDYDPAETADFFTSCGFNYHSGPEWVWLTGFFFRASMRFRRKVSERMLQTLAAIKRTFKESVAFGLPELTNGGGVPCPHACTTQAWSVATVLDMLFDYGLYTEEDPLDWQAEEEDLPE